MRCTLWQEWCSAHGVECLAVQPPGRLLRGREPPFTRCCDIAEALLPVVASKLIDTPYVVRRGRNSHYLSAGGAVGRWEGVAACHCADWVAAAFDSSGGCQADRSPYVVSAGGSWLRRALTCQQLAATAAGREQGAAVQ